MNRTAVGLVLCLLSLLLGGLFFIKGYHEVYWSHPAVFVLITLMGVLSPLLGGLLLGWALAAKRGGAGGALQRYAFGAGVIFTIAGAFLSVSAIGMTLGVSSTGYWGHPPYEYEGDYVIMRFQIDLFRFAILPELIGGLLLGAGLQMRNKNEAG